MLDTSLQHQLEQQGKDELRNHISERLGGDYAHFLQLLEMDNDDIAHELAMDTLKHIFKTLKKEGINL
jgi:hypothetical protein